MTFKKLNKVLFIGHYEENYSRNSIFIKGLKEYNVQIIEFNVKSFSILKHIKTSLKNFPKLHSQEFDVIILHAPSWIQVLLAKVLSKIKKVPLIHDIYISKVQTFYHDRKKYKTSKIPKLLYLIYVYLLDFFECILADYLILDTNSHIKYFYEKFKVPIKKFRRIFIGANEKIFHPIIKKKKREGDTFTVGFWGTFIPLQGIQFILKAAKILQNESEIQFKLIGNGQTFEESRELAKKLNLNNVIFKGFIPLKELPEYISDFDIGLGIFGDTNKTIQVIPNKVYEGNAMKLPMISCDSPAIRELYTHKENILLCERANPESIALGILDLMNNIELRENIKEKAFKIFNENCSISAIGKRLYSITNKILKNNN